MVPGGGLSPDGSRWLACKPGFFLPVRVLSRLFRRLFLEHLQNAFDLGKLQFFSSLQYLRDRCAFVRYLAPLRRAEWVVYAKRPAAGPEQVLDYVGRYTHRVAISNNRLLDIENGQIRFQMEGLSKPRSAENHDTLRRGIHSAISPPRFAGWISPHSLLRLFGQSLSAEKLTRCRQLLDMATPELFSEPPSQDYRDRHEELTGTSLRQCPVAAIAVIW